MTLKQTFKRSFAWAATISVLLAVPVVGATTWVLCPSSAETQDRASSVLYDAAEIASHRRLAILIPGSLNSVDIYAGANRWRSVGYALAYYRFPGMDGRALDGTVEIRAAAADIIRFSREFPDKEIYLVGYSTGAQIALQVASELPDRVRKVAAISSAVGFPETIWVSFRVGIDLARRALHLRTLDISRIWLDYYRVLLFGRERFELPAPTHQAAEIIASRRQRIVTPTSRLICAHFGGLALGTGVSGPVKGVEVRFFHGSEDPVVPVRAVRNFAAKLSESSIEVLDGHGHIPMLTAPDLFERVRRFLES
jgi:pimeloyl-ACP methyl ester carboxylesterase